MTTVQVAIWDAEYAQTIANVLRREGSYSVLMVEEPDAALEGVVVLDCEHLDALALAGEAPERFVLVTRKDPQKLEKLWNAGIRHVVFQEDSPSTVQLAVSAAELRQPRNSAKRQEKELYSINGPRPILQRHYRIPGQTCEPRSCSGGRCGCHGLLAFPEIVP